MNYLKEILAFYDYLLYNPVPTGEIALWYALMAINNRSGWRGSFAASNLILQQATSLSRSGLDSARNGLKQRGLIEYRPGRGNKPGEYRMVPLVCNISDTPEGTPAAHGQADAGHTGGPAYNNVLDKQKQKDIVPPPAEPKRAPVFAEDSEEMRLSRLLFDRMRENNPKCREPNWQAWARVFDLILRVDRRDPRDVADMIRFCQWDNFWRQNILSPGKLREKYDQLTVVREGVRKHAAK